jgi:site-specific DNA-methyltransferase (adenine-specific)
MIIPARWYAGGKGLDEFRNIMLKDKHIKVLHDFNNASECFPNVEIKGGVCYFLWEKDYSGNCEVNTHSNNEIISSMSRPLLEEGCDSFIRQNEAISILRKVQSKKETSFSNIVSSRKPFGLATNFTDFEKEYFHNSIKIYANQKVGYVDKKYILRNIDWINSYKIIIPEAIGVGDMTKDWLKPIIVDVNTCCTETYLVVGPFKDEIETQNVYSYMQTKFFHLMLGLKKVTQHTTSKVYELVPLQDFSKPWTDEELYAKYGLTEEEIAFIESMIKPME